MVHCGARKPKLTLWVSAALLLLCAAPAALADEAASAGPARLPHGCRPDDARCLALQADVCDPWNITTTDK